MPRWQGWPWAILREDWGAITAAWPITEGCGGVSRGEQASRGAAVVLWGGWTTGRGESHLLNSLLSCCWVTGRVFAHLWAFSVDWRPGPRAAAAQRVLLEPGRRGPGGLGTLPPCPGPWGQQRVGGARCQAGDRGPGDGQGVPRPPQPVPAGRRLAAAQLPFLRPPGCLPV